MTSTTTINGIPEDRLGGTLPEPLYCPVCHDPCWHLKVPHGRDQNGRPVSLDSLMDYTPRPVCGQGWRCSHPYHLAPHECRPGKIVYVPPRPVRRVVREHIEHDR